jgi:hypothetical protein
LKFELLKRKFNWTFYGFIRLNLVVPVIILLDFFSGETSGEKLLGGFIFLLKIVNLFVFVFLPMLDLYEYYRDKKICNHFQINYIDNYLLTFSEKEKEIIREQFSKFPLKESTRIEDLLVCKSAI